MNFIIVLLGYLIITSFFTYGAGWIVLYFTRNQNFSEHDHFGRISLNLIVGFLLISSLTGIFATDGVSLSWLVLLPLIYFLYQTSSSFKQEFQAPRKFPFVTAAIILIISLFGIWLLNGAPQNMEELRVHDDFYFYAKNAGSLIKTGVESPRSLHFMSMPLGQNEIYHFGNLWFSAFFIKIFSCSEVAFLVFVAYPLLITICFLGCLSFFSPKRLRSIPIFLPIVFLVFFGGTLLFNSNNSFLHAANLWYSELFGLSPTTLKLTPILALTPLLFHFLLNRKLANIACFTLIISGLYTSVLPGFYGVFVGILIWTIFFDKKYKPECLKKDIIESLTIMALGTLFLFLYQEFATQSAPIKPWFEITKPEAIVWSIKYFGYPFVMFLGLIPAIIWSIATKKIQLKALLFSTVIGLFASICFVMLNIFHLDINQVIINFMMAIMPVLLVYFVAKIHTKSRLLFGITISILSLTTLNKFYNSKITNLYPVKTSEKFQRDAFIEIRHSNWAIIRKDVPWKWYFIYDNPVKYILNHPGTIYPIDITAGIMKEGRSPFRKKDFDIPGYLKEKKVEFLFAENGSQLPEKANLSLLLTDSKSGNKLYRINP